TGNGPVQLSPQDCLTVVTHLEGKGVADLRRLDIALKIYHAHSQNDEWKALVDRDLSANAPIRSSDECIVQALEARTDLTTVEQRVAEFTNQTGESRATYFRIKSRLRL